MENHKKKMVMLFPGAGYNVDNPLFYYADYKYESNGYERFALTYGDYFKEKKNMDEIKNFVSSQVDRIDFSVYDEVIFFSKSIGTILAGFFAESLDINIKHVYLTPLYDTLNFLKNGENIKVVIAGTADKYMDTKVLEEHCLQEKINLKLMKDADHSLEMPGNINATIDILRQVIELY